MLSFRTLALLAVVAALIAVAPAVGGSSSARQSAVPPAQAAGGDVAPILPSIVNTRIVRAEAALSSATSDADQNQPAQGAVALAAAVSNLGAAWNAEKYVIKTTPPPPASDAFPDGTGAAGPTYAGPEDTGFAVLTAQHDAIAAAVSLAETTNATLQKSLLSAISAEQAAILAEVKYIHSIAPAPPAQDGAEANGGLVASTWSTVMPGYVAVLDDEIQQIKGRLTLRKFPAVVTTALNSARLEAADTKSLVNKYWPPLPADG
jgi:hypothetical protein